MVEDEESRAADRDARDASPSKHEPDLRWACQAICLLYEATSAEWTVATAWAGFTEDELANCLDIAAD